MTAVKSPANRWLVLAVVSSALLLIVIDMTVLYTALPRLTHDLAATASEKLWIVNAYPLVVAGLLPGLGTLGDRLGHRRMFLSGLVVFGLASLAAAFSNSAEMLIAARVALAVGAAQMMPATLSIIRLTFTDDAERAFAIGIWAAVASGGAALGPVVGGVLLEFFWWGSVFLINVPVVLVALIAGATLVERRPGNPDRPWDIVASAQIMVALVAGAVAIKEFGKRDPSLVFAGAAALVAVLASVVFARRQNRSNTPLIDFALFRNPGFSGGVATAMTASAVLVGVELVLSQRLQLVQGMSPLQAGLMILPIPLAAFVAGPMAGIALPRIGGTRMLGLSMGIAALGLLGFFLARDAAAPIWLCALAVMGFGIGAAMTAASTSVMTSAPEDRAGMAASVEEVSYELGGALGIAVLGSLMSALYSAAFLLPEGVSPQAADSLDQALMLAETLPAAQAQLLVETGRAAFEGAFTGVIGAGCVILVLVAGWLIRRAGGAPPVAGRVRHP